MDARIVFLKLRGFGSFSDSYSMKWYSLRLRRVRVRVRSNQGYPGMGLRDHRNLKGLALG